MAAKEPSVSSAISRYCRRPLRVSRRTKAETAVGLPAGGGEAWSGFGGAPPATGGGGRVLQRLAARSQRAERRHSVLRYGGIVERSGCMVVEADNHGVGQLEGCTVVAHVAGGDPGVDECMNGESVIVEHAGDFFVRRCDATVRDYVAQRSVSIPGFLREPVQSEQRKLPGRVHAEHARGLKVGGDGHRI